MSEVTLDHHIHSIGDADVEGILEDYTDESVLIIPNAVLKGLDEIRDLYVNLTTEILPPGSDIHLHEKVVEDNIGYVIWHAESDGYKIPFASDTFVFSDEDKIEVHTSAFVLHEKE